MAIIFLLPWLEEPENFDSCTEKCCQSYHAWICTCCDGVFGWGLGLLHV